jgi:hypothetical protein
MTTLEDTLSDEEVEKIEEAKKQAKREKTKYGHLLGDEDE